MINWNKKYKEGVLQKVDRYQLIQELGEIYYDCLGSDLEGEITQHVIRAASLLTDNADEMLLFLGNIGIINTSTIDEVLRSN